MKLVLTIRTGTRAGQTVEVTAQSLTIGRGTECGLQFDPQTERIVSTRHAYIQRAADGFYLTDHQSTNGTFVNGAKIDKVKLRDGDTVSFGSDGPQAAIQIQAHSATAPASATPPVAVPDSGIGLYNPDRPSAGTAAARIVGIAIALCVAGFLALLVSVFVFAELGLAAGLVAAAVAFLPAIIYAIPMFWLDRYDPEPPWLLASAFAWGALIAVIVSLVINSLFGAIFGEVVGMVFSAPVFEEASKGAGLLALLWFFRREFDDIVDGIVYAGIIALGFATVENVFYYGRNLLEHGEQGLYETFVVRGVLSPFAHVIFTSMTGIGCGLARESHNSFVRFIMPVLGYCAAVALHAIWNGMAVFAGDYFIVGYALFEIPFFLLFVGFVFWVAHRERRILREMLAAEVAMGLVTEEHVKTATSSFKRTGWLLAGLANGKFNVRRKFLRALAKLGLSYWHIQRATEAHGETRSFQLSPILRKEVQTLRQMV
jgi:RsiW-degrading membrane proteinase PrsW (M82 family)